ncbi:MAG: DNA mismatch repair endonuclease MutL [Weeksellaceae bacterium]
MKIKILSPEVHAKIAAGEVIERPAYIVKELIENALDAQAKTVQISLKDHGMTAITVKDDGVGMDREDLTQAYLPHATSKITAVEDLSNISSFGFRGEALASIAAIGTLTIKSRAQHESVGSSIVIRQSKASEIESCGMAPGTIVEVADVFQSIPARKKFLASATAEYRRMLDIILRFAIMHHTVRFEVIHNNSVVHIFPKTDNLATRLEDIFSDEITAEVFPVNFEYEYIVLTGFSGKPSLRYTSTRNIYIFINGRMVKESTINAAIKEAYASLLDVHSYPFTVLQITLPAHMLDVNIHPRKEQVMFADPTLMRETLIASFREALTAHDLTFATGKWQTTKKESDRWVKEANPMKSHAAKTLKSKILRSQTAKDSDYIQLHNTYIVTSVDNETIIVDQHAAHERVLYEQFVSEYQAELQKKKQVSLAKQIRFNLNPVELTVLSEHQAAVTDLGFTYTLEENAVVVTEVPELFKDRDIKQIFTDIIDGLGETGGATNLDNISHRMLTYLSCKNAVKAGQELAVEQQKEIIKKLFETESPYTCPHGRPTHISLPLKDLEKMFHRR